MNELDDMASLVHSVIIKSSTGQAVCRSWTYIAVKETIFALKESHSIGNEKLTYDSDTTYVY